MTSATSAIFTIILCGSVYWYYYGPNIINGVTLEIVTDTRDGKLHSLNFLKEDVDHKFVQDKTSIMARLYFKFKYPHGRYIIMEEVLFHVFDQFFLSTAFVGDDIVIFVEPTTGVTLDSITPIMWKSVGMQGIKFVVVNQRDTNGNPIHWELYSAHDTDDPENKGEDDDDDL